MKIPLVAALAIFAAADSGVTLAGDIRLFAKDNLIAWCIVPYDAKKRSPEERAAMLGRLGIRRLAYDWRNEHLPTLDRELDALRKHRIRMDAIWFPVSLDPEKDVHARTILDFIRRRKLKTQLWLSLGVPESNNGHEERMELAAKAAGWVAREAEKVGCKVALYNHGGWFGEPENQIAVIERIKMRNVGIVYNFHHAHHRIDDFSVLMKTMKPHLLALNLNGMRKEGPKILTIGEGDRELEMLKAVKRSGWRGPIGILNHREEMDAEEALRLNMSGLEDLKQRLTAN